MEFVLDRILAVLAGTWEVLGLMAPYLLGGFLVAGVLAVVLPAAWVERHLGRRGLGPVVTAAAVGVPLPLCSCGVLPVAMGIRDRGASRGATTSFLLSTPQTGVDSIAVSWALLGPWVALYRAVMAFLAGLVGGALVTATDVDRDRREGAPERAPKRGERPDNRLTEALRHGLVVLPRDVAPSLLIGALVAGAMAALVPPGALVAVLGGGVLATLAMMGVGIPLYVCATSSVPVAIGFMHAGATIGAAFAFLVAGPATNAATIAAVWRFLGRRATLLYLGTVAAVAFGGGLLLDVLLPGYRPPLVPAADPHHAAAMAWWAHLAAAALVAVLVLAWASRFPGRRAASRGCAADGGTVLAVTGMTCDHCAGRVHDALAQVAGVTRVTVDRATGRATVAGAGVDPGDLVAAVDAAGYQATPVPRERCCHA